MKTPTLVALVTSALLTAVSCSRAETPTEPSSTGFLRVTTVLEGSCPSSITPGLFPVFVDGSQIGTVAVPGSSSFVISVGSHTVHVGMAPASSALPVYIEPDRERTVQWGFGCSGLFSQAKVLTAQ